MTGKRKDVKEKSMMSVCMDGRTLKIEMELHY